MLYIVGGKHKKRKLITPKSSQVRPTTTQVREAVFNICQNEIEGADFLDLFAGSGAMGLEALSRGAKHTTFVEKRRDSLVAIKQNIVTLQEENHTTVIAKDVIQALKSLKSPFDCIYADPPYGQGWSSLLLEKLNTNALLKKGGRLFIEDTSCENRNWPYIQLIKKRAFGRSFLFEFTHAL